MTIECVICALVLLCGRPASGRVITVSQDGVGDFSTLEQASNALSVGDTLSIGAGQWDAVYQWDDGAGDVIPVLLGVSVDSVTVVGVSTEETILGQSLSSLTRRLSVNAIVLGSGADYIRVEQLSVLGTTRGYVDARGDFAEFYQVNFDQSDVAAVVFGHAVFDACSFRRSGTAEILSLDSGANVVVAECNFTGGNVGLQMNPGSIGFVSGSRFESVDSAIIADGTEITIVDSEFLHVNLPFTARRPGGRLEIRRATVESSAFGGFYCRTTAIVDVVDSVFLDVHSPVIDISSNAQVHMTGSQILPRDNGLFINASTLTTSPRIDLNFENNYWGTTDAEEIRARIVDGEDWPGNPAFNIFVDFEPILLVPVEGAAESVGSLKARFLSRDD